MTEKRPHDGSHQRIDKWLFFARMVKSRSRAQTLIEAGAVSINGLCCDGPGRTVKPGDRVGLRLERRDLLLVVKAAGARRGTFEETKLLYEDLTSLPVDEEAQLTPYERALRRPVR